MQVGVGVGEKKFLFQSNLEKDVYSEKSSAKCPGDAVQHAPSPPVRNLIESRNSLTDGLEHLLSSINLLDSLLDALRPSPGVNSCSEKEQFPSGQIMTSFDLTAELYSRHLNRLRRRIEELDGILGSGFCSVSVDSPRRG